MCILSSNAPSGLLPCLDWFGWYGSFGSISLGGKVPEQQDEEGNKDDRDRTRKSDEAVQGDGISRDDLHLRPVLPASTLGNHKVGDADRVPHQELHDLHAGEETLPSGLISKACQGVVCVHDGVDEGIEEDKDPSKAEFRCRLQPHAEDGSGVVEGLQEGGLLALCQQDEGVEEFVIFANVKDPNPHGHARI